MKVSNIISGLLSSELSNTYLTALESTDLNTKMLIWINQALRDINLRVPIIQKSFTYKLVEDSIDNGITYMAPSDYQGLLSAWNESGKPISINSTTDPLSVFTPDHFKVLIPYSTLGALVTIVYQASVPELTSVDDDLPVGAHFEAIISFYVATKALAGLETQGKPVNLAYEQKYEKAMNLLITSGMYNPEPIQEATHFERGGWK